MKVKSMRPAAAATPGEIITFYSYKGGTGRTMSLVNLACLLAQELESGERMLLIDWDLEAPGLHRYFHGHLGTADEHGPDAAKDDVPGVIDLFEALRELGEQAKVKRLRRQDRRAEALFDGIMIDDYVLKTSIPGIDIVKAGRFDSSYGARVSGFPWEDFYNRHPLAFREFAQRLKQRYRYVLIDSRTGQTDTAGICTTLMPEKLVLVFTPNRQSLYGIESVLKNAVAYRRRDADARPLVAYPLPSRVEVTLDDLRAKWRFGDTATNIEGYERFLTRLLRDAYGLRHCHLKGYFEKVQVKHSPIYAFGEEIAVLNERNQGVKDEYSLTHAYHNLLAWIKPGFLPWENPEVIRLLRAIESRCRSETLERQALAEDLQALRKLAQQLLIDGDRGNAELAVRSGERYARKQLGDSHPESIAYANELTEVLFAQGEYSQALQHSRATLELAKTSLGEEHPATLTAMNNLASTLQAQGDLAGARVLQESALAIRRHVLGEEHLDTLSSISNLASTLQAQGDLAGARAQQELALAAHRRLLGEEHPATLTAMNNLASTLQAQSDLAGARTLQESALAIQRRVLGEEHPDTLTSINNLAGTLYAQGDLAGARAREESVLAIRRRVLGEEHPDTLSSMNNLANTLMAQGDLAGARALQKSVLAIQRRVLGEEHPGTLTSMNNLAATLHAQGDLAGARVLEESALATRRRVLGEEHPDTLTSKNNLASTLQAQGDLVGARALQESALATRRRVLGEEHPATLSSMNNLAGTLYAEGDLAGARALQNQELATCRRVLGEEHPDTLTSMNNLANTLMAQGDLAGARTLQESALATRRRVLGEEHPATLSSMSNLANTLMAQGDLAGARALQESALATRRRVLGEEHPATLSSISSLADTLYAQGDLGGARALQEAALAIRRRVLGEEHPDTLTSMHNLAGTLQAQGDLAGAQTQHESVLAARRRVLGEEHPATLTSLNNLAGTLYAQGNLAAARALQESALTTQRRVLGEEHPATLSSMNNLAGTLYAQGDFSGAKELQESALAIRRRVLGEEHPATLTVMKNLAATLQAMDQTEAAEVLQKEADAISHRNAERSKRHQQGAAVRIAGVGGAGGNALQAIQKLGLRDVGLVAINSDRLAIDRSGVEQLVLLGNGLGAGGRADLAELAAEQRKAAIRDALEGTRLLIIVAGLGGGTGSGAAPVVADIAREMGIVSVAIVTTPFGFEGRRTKLAAAAEEKLLRKADALIVIRNDDLMEKLGEEATMEAAFASVDAEIAGVVQGIVEIATTPGLVNIDLEDLRSIFSGKGRAAAAIGLAEGPDRAAAAVTAAIKIIDEKQGFKLATAASVLVNISADRSLRMKEISRLMETLRPLVSPAASLIFGAVFDESLKDKLRATIIAAGIATQDIATVAVDKAQFRLAEVDLPAFLRKQAE